MAVHSLQQRGTTLATMVNNEQVGCLHTHVYLYIWCVRCLLHLSWPNSSQLLRAEHRFCKPKGGRPRMLKLLVMAVYLIACSHVRISSCSASTPLFSYQRVWECFHGECAKAQHQRDGEEGGAATEDGAEQSARGQSCGKGAEGTRRTSMRTRHHASTLRSPNTYCRLHSMCWEVHTHLSHSSTQWITHGTPVRPFVTICPRVLFQPWQNPPLTFGLDLLGIRFLQYGVSRHTWPQLSRTPVSQEKGISVLWGLLGIPCWVHLY